jgi:hydroxyacylglutathione hydrolase
MRIITKTEHFKVFQSALFKTNTTVIETEDGIFLFDPNWLPEEVEAIKQYVYSIKGDKPLYLIFTHSDWDHILGYGAFPDAITIGSKEMANLVNKEEIILQIDKFDQEYYISRDYEVMYPKIDIEVRKNGQILQIGGTKLTFYHAKGHTGDGIFTIIEPLGLLVAGDYLSDVEPPYIYWSSIDYDQTLLKAAEIFKEYSIKWLIPGHGHPTESLNEMKTRQQAGIHYIQKLRAAIIEGQTDEETLFLLEGYSFPKGIKPFHFGNYKLIKKEIII